jgi:hypothetical protein
MNFANVMCLEQGELPQRGSTLPALRLAHREAQKMSSLITDLRILIVDDSDTTRRILGCASPKFYTH